MSQGNWGPPQGGHPPPQQPGMQPPQQQQMQQPQMQPHQQQHQMQQPGMQQPGMQQPGMQQPGMQQHAGVAGGTVGGVALQPGERVVYYSETDFSTTKIVYLVMGILFAVILIGLIFLWMRSRIDKNNPRAIIVTTHRVIIAHGNGTDTQIWLQNMADIEPMRQQSTNAGGGLLGAAIGAAVTAVANKMADNKAKADPKYWSRAYGITFTDHQGGTQQVTCAEQPKQMIDLGLFISRGMMSGGFLSHPAVQYNP